MELNQIKYFQTIAEEGSFTKAAQKLYLSQPALSKSMARLESELGVELFTRQGMRLELNTVGRLFLSQMETAMRQIADGVQCVRDQAGLEQGCVSIALSESIELDHLFEQFLCDYPNVHFQEKYYPIDEIGAKLLDGTCDFAVLSQQLCSPNINWLPLFDDHICVLLSRSHPLANRNKIFAEQLSQERIAQGDRSFRNAITMSGIFVPVQDLNPTSSTKEETPAWSAGLSTGGLLSLWSLNLSPLLWANTSPPSMKVLLRSHLPILNPQGS